MRVRQLDVLNCDIGANESSASTSGHMRVFLETYGCQMNVADSELITGILSRAGFQMVSGPESADVILLNTCAVRENAEERVFGRLGELTQYKNSRPHVLMGVVGCMAEHLREEILGRAKAVGLVVGPDSYRRLPHLIESALAGPVVDITLDKSEQYLGLEPDRGGGVTAWIPIMRGCNRFCTFCVVPYTRGREKNLPPEEIVRQVEHAVNLGHSEVCLLGQTVNSYRHGDTDFADLVRMVGAVDGIRRLRFMSPHPVGFTASLVDAIAEVPAVCPHVHLPLQSGSDAVLTRMRRDYSAQEFRAVLSDLRHRIPGISVSTDIVVGFCGETEDDHRRTVEFVEESRFDFAFTFMYSPRAGTFAARFLKDDVPAEVKRRRISEVIALQERISADIHAKLVGSVREVLFEGSAKKGDAQSFGRTADFKGVVVEGSFAPNSFRSVRITGANAHTLTGEVLPDTGARP